MNTPTNYTVREHGFVNGTGREASAKPKTSVIVVMWNNLELNKKCVRSILAYTENYELILVDNVSTDGTREWLQQIDQEIPPNVAYKTIFMNKNVGWPAGVNAGLRQAKGENVLFMNNDIEVTANWLKDMTTHLEYDEAIGAVGATTNFVMGLQKAELNKNFARFGNQLEVKYLIGFCMLVRGSALEKVGLIDEDYWDIEAGSGSADDIDFSIRLRQAGYKLVIARNVFLQHHGSKSFELIFGKELYKAGTEAHAKYTADVEKYLTQLRKKYSEEVVQDTLKIDAIPDDCPGTIAVPHGDFIPADSVHSLISLAKPAGVQICFNYGSGVSKARNNMVEAMRGDWLAFIDSDMTFPPNALLKLLEHLQHPAVDIVTGICYRKVPGYEPCIFKRVPGYALNYEVIADWPEDKLFEIDACGSAFVVIKRHVFEALKAPHYSYHDFISEDLNFCRRAKEMGFRIWADPSINIGHVKAIPVGKEVFRKTKKYATMAERTRNNWPELFGQETPRLAVAPVAEIDQTPVNIIKD
jgi:GT2 family glycosyltransferase